MSEPLDPRAPEPPAAAEAPTAPIPIAALAERPVFTLGDGALEVLVVDNYDSFTYNLVQALVVLDARVSVVRNDALSVDELLALEPDAVVLSPGPGRPPEDAGVCVELFERRLELPILGVCLGHQAFGVAFGAEVERAPRQMHGKTSAVEYRPHRLFRDLPNPFDATRYHSLHVPERSLPDQLVGLAWSDDGVLMAMAHRELPYLGVQFHPESVLTREGPRLLGNFLDLARGDRRREHPPSGAPR